MPDLVKVHPLMSFLATLERRVCDHFGSIETLREVSKREKFLRLNGTEFTAPEVIAIIDHLRSLAV